MEKDEIITHYENSIELVKSFEQLSEEQWRTPIAHGKWTVAEVIGHLTPWDLFMLNERIPYLNNSKKMPKFLVENQVNTSAAKVARNASKHKTINNFISTRQKLIKAIIQIDDALWDRIITIGTSNVSINQYFSGFVKHDEHHFTQIDLVLEKV